VATKTIECFGRRWRLCSNEFRIFGINEIGDYVVGVRPCLVCGGKGLGIGFAYREQHRVVMYSCLVHIYHIASISHTMKRSTQQTLPVLNFFVAHIVL